MADKHPQVSLDKDDNEALLLDTDTKNEINFASTLMNINNTMLAMSTVQGINSRATQLKFECPRMSYYASPFHYGRQSIACFGQ